MFSLNLWLTCRKNFTPSVLRVAALLQLFSFETKKYMLNVSKGLLHTLMVHIHTFWACSRDLHLTFRDQACNPKLWMVLMSGRGLTESNKRCHWINKLHMPWKHRQPLSDNIGMAAHKSLAQTMSSNTAWRLSSLKAHEFMGMSLWVLESNP